MTPAGRVRQGLSELPLGQWDSRVLPQAQWDSPALLLAQQRVPVW